MASKLNSEFNYRHLVIGETPWEKIKTLRGFLIGRKRAAVLETVNDLKYRAKKAELAHLKTVPALPHILLNLEAEIMELESSLQDAYEAYRLNEDEIKVLEKLIAELLEIAEPTRIPGYSEEQMYEANAENEFTAMIAKEIYAEMVANGRPSPAKLHNAMSNPNTFLALQSIGLIPAKTKMLTVSADPCNIKLGLVDAAKLLGAPE
jgi:hypothetical protein